VSTRCGISLDAWVSLKKTTRYAERKYTQRIEYLRSLRALIPQYGKDNLVYIDESGFEQKAFNPYAWSPRGQKVYGDKTGNSKQGRTNLVMAQRGKEWIAPVLFKGSCDAALVEDWMENHLFKELCQPSIIVLDNAPFHRKTALRSLAGRYHHHLLFLPPYSPDFNPIEHSFGLLKRRWRYYPGASLEYIITGNYYWE
jgi:transposase